MTARSARGRPSPRRSPRGAPRYPASRARGSTGRGSCRRTPQSAAGACGRSSARSCRRDRAARRSGPGRARSPASSASSRCACCPSRPAAPDAAHSRDDRSARPPSPAPPAAWSAAPTARRPDDLLLRPSAGEQLIDHLVRDPLAIRPLQHRAQSRALDGVIHRPARARGSPSRGRRRLAWRLAAGAIRFRDPRSNETSCLWL